MKPDIFEFWSKIKLGEKIHPADWDVLKSKKTPNNFALNCWPAPYLGPLKSAKVVLLFLNPGLTKPDCLKSEEKRCFHQLNGKLSLPPHDEHSTAHRWIRTVTKNFGEFETIKDRVAVLELCAYHSKEFKDWHMLAALPSSRMASDWAQNVLFPDAIAGKKLVVCMRSSKYWGLKSGERYGVSLFAPPTTRGGHLRLTHQKIIHRIVRDRLELTHST